MGFRHSLLGILLRQDQHRHRQTLLPEADQEQASGSLLEALRGAAKCEFPDELTLRRAEEAWLRWQVRQM